MESLLCPLCLLRNDFEYPRCFFCNREEKRSKKCPFEVEPCSWLHVSGVQPDDLARVFHYAMEALSGAFTWDEAPVKKVFFKEVFIGHGASLGREPQQGTLVSFVPHLLICRL